MTPEERAKIAEQFEKMIPEERAKLAEQLVSIWIGSTAMSPQTTARLVVSGDKTTGSTPIFSTQYLPDPPPEEKEWDVF